MRFHILVYAGNVLLFLLLCFASTGISYQVFLFFIHMCRVMFTFPRRGVTLSSVKLFFVTYLPHLGLHRGKTFVIWLEMKNVLLVASE